MRAIHCALRAWTGSLLTSACHQLLAGKFGQLVPGMWWLVGSAEAAAPTAVANATVTAHLVSDAIPTMPKAFR
jgi:hypothetical protein